MTIASIQPVGPDEIRPLWSVMIPLYRPSIAMLRDALAGPLASGVDRTKMQIVLVDDASGLDWESPPLRDLAQECRDLGIEIHLFDINLGLAGNWNRCLNLSRGHLIHLLHQDDRVDPTFYDAISAGFERETRIGAAFTQHSFITSNGDRIRLGHLQSDTARILDEWLEYIFANLAIQCLAIVVKRAVYEQLGGFDTRYRHCCDREMWQRIAMEYPLWFDPRPLSEFRVHESATSAKLLRRSSSWWEVNRCATEVAKRISPPARTPAMRSFRRHTLRLALVEAKQALRKGDWRGIVAIAMGAAPLLLRPREVYKLNLRRLDRTPPSRAPDRPIDDAAKRSPRILFLTEFFPWDPVRSVSGAMQRLRFQVRALDRLGPVDAVFFSAEKWPSSPNDIAWRSALARQSWPLRGSVHFVTTSDAGGFFERVTDCFWTLRGIVGFADDAPNMRSCRRRQVESVERIMREVQPDLVFAVRISSAAPLLRIRSECPPIIVDFDDIESVRLERLAMSVQDLTEKWKARFAAWLARKAQRRVSAAAASVLVCSEIERLKVQSMRRNAHVAVIPNTAVALGELPVASQPVAIFVGTAWYPPNREAVLWLTNEIWPQVRRAVPEARLIVVGEKTDELGVSSSQLGIEALGFAADLAPLYAQAMLAVCPIRRGSGTRIKIVEASMNGRPTVSTTLGAEGLAFAAGTEIVMADEAKDFAEGCIRLFRDPTQAALIGKNALQRARSTYQEDRIAESLRAICADALRGDRNTGSHPIADPRVTPVTVSGGRT